MAQDKKFSAIFPLYKDSYKDLAESLFHLHEQEYKNIPVSNTQLTLTTN